MFHLWFFYSCFLFYLWASLRNSDDKNFYYSEDLSHPSQEFLFILTLLHKCWFFFSLINFNLGFTLHNSHPRTLRWELTDHKIYFASSRWAGDFQILYWMISGGASFSFSFFFIIKVRSNVQYLPNESMKNVKGRKRSVWLFP